MPGVSTLSSPTKAGASLPLTATPATPDEHNCEAVNVVVTLRSLYSRAARAFLQRDLDLTLTLITSALPLMPSPPLVDDPLTTWRRKWDILRITLETTVYANPPADPESIPSHLRANLVLSPQNLLGALHVRSLLLFTPVLPDSQIQDSVNAAYLPTQVLLTLALASLKLGVPDVGRGIIENWLARRNDHNDAGSEGAGYDKVIELYCLHILPRLEEWDYATEFLQYEGQLGSVRRHRLMSSLETLHAETMGFRQQRPKTPSTPSLSPSLTALSRPVSPSGSSVSSSSEQTATPRTPRLYTEDSNSNLKSLPMPMTSISAPPSISDSTSRTATPMPSQVVARPKYKQKQRYSISRAPVLDPPSSASSVKAPSTLAVIKSMLSMAKASFTPQINLVTLLIFAFALFSLIRFRRSKQKSHITSGDASTPTSALNNYTLGVRTLMNGTGEARSLGTTAGSAVDVVRKKLASPSDASGSTGILGLLWKEAFRAVGDTIRMGGRGLV